MELLTSKVSNLNVLNNLPGDSELQLQINVNYNISTTEEDPTIVIGTIDLDIEDVNDENDYPFSIAVTFQGVLKCIMGESLEKQSFKLLYKELRKFVSNVSRDLGLSPLELPDVELEFKNNDSDFVEDTIIN